MPVSRAIWKCPTDGRYFRKKMSEHYLDRGKYGKTGKTQDMDERLKHMSPSDKLKMYGQLLLTAQRFMLKGKYPSADLVRGDAEKILLHFETTMD